MYERMNEREPKSLQLLMLTSQTALRKIAGERPEQRRPKKTTLV